MSENDIIAKYVEERFPNILQTTDFAIFKMNEVVKESVRTMSESLKKIDFSGLKEALERMNKNDANGQ